MKTIHKYQIPISDTITVKAPEDAEPLHVDLQHGQPCLWMRVDTEKESTSHTFHWRGTGHPVDGLGKHIGTVLVDGGNLVFHLFAD